MEYAYPDNLCARPVLWFWELRHVSILGVCLLLSVLAFATLEILLPLVLSALFAFLTIRLEEMTILEYIRFSIRFFLTGQQVFYWR